MTAFMKKAAALLPVSLAFITCLLAGQTWAKDEKCFPPIDTNQSQFLVAYGSLLHDAVREKKLERSVLEQPVWVSGYKRGWLTRDLAGKGNKTHLGVVREDGQQFNGALVSISSARLKSLDPEDKGLCRTKLDPGLLIPMAGGALPEKGEIWLYETRSKQIKKPAANYPILQSEVDIFLTGCIEQAEQFDLKTFPQQCVDSTLGWTIHWNNDRHRPSTGKLVQNRRSQIDKLLERLEGDLYEKIRTD
ncbi:MAG: gamma-glutamylcyclotransferase family protein [Endozoicomonas sp.]